jgi:hypothetical protein
MSRNYNAEPTANEQDSRSSEKLRTVATKGLAAVAIGLALFGIGKGLESGSNDHEEAARDTISEVYSEVPEAGEGTFVGDILDTTNRSRAGGLSGDIELAMSINERGDNTATPVYVDQFKVFPEDSPAISLVDNEGYIPYTEDMVNDLSVAHMHAKTSEVLDTAGEVTQLAGSAGLVVGGVAAAGASMAAARKRNQ